MLPGSLIKSGLEFIGVDPASCNCIERAAQMDAWGVDGCRDNIEKIVGWFVDEGRRRDLVASQTPQFRNIVRQGLLLLIDRSEALAAMESLGVDPLDSSDAESAASLSVSVDGENDASSIESDMAEFEVRAD